MQTSFPVVKGYKLRATKINNCGMPIAGANNRLVTSGFITVDLTMVTQAAQDLEQSNAEGLICVSDRTPPQRKWYTPAIELCDVDPQLINMFSGWPVTLDYAGNPNGYKDATAVDEDYGVAIEIWTGGRSGNDCPTPINDSIFTTTTTGLQYGYFLLGGIEWTMGNIRIGASVSTFTLTGRTIPMPQWGMGPYNVAAIDSSGTPGRLLTPLGQDEHYTVFRTPVPPPDNTLGAVPLAITSVFTAPNYYYGGPTNAPACTVAPDQPAVGSWTVATTGAPTGGWFTLLLNGAETPEIAYDAAATDLASALAAALDVTDGITASDFTVTGGPLPTAITVTTAFEATLTVAQNGLTGGTTPEVTVN